MNPSINLKQVLQAKLVRPEDYKHKVYMDRVQEEIEEIEQED